MLAMEETAKPKQCPANPWWPHRRLRRATQLGSGSAAVRGAGHDRGLAAGRPVRDGARIDRAARNVRSKYKLRHRVRHCGCGLPAEGADARPLRQAAQPSPESARRPRHDRDRKDRQQRQDRHERQQRMERQGQRGERKRSRPTPRSAAPRQGDRVERAEREQYYAKPYGGSDRRDKQPDPNSPFAKLAALKQQLEQSAKEPS